MNFLRKLLIPKDNVTEVTELESYTVSWQVKEGWGGHVNHYHKVFIKKDEAIEFRQQLKNSADFIGAWIETSLKQN